MGNEKRGWDDSLISLGLGALVVVVSGILLYNFFSTTSRDLLTDLSQSMSEQTSSTQIDESTLEDVVTESTPEPVVVETQPSATPVEIAAATPIAEPIAQITPAPTVAVAQATVAPTQAPVAQTETVAVTRGTIEDKYIVVRGDSLWKLAEAYYGDGFKWRMIAQANNLQGSELEVGRELTIPREGMTSSTSTIADAGNSSDEGTSTVPPVGGAGQSDAVSSVSTSRTVIAQRGDTFSGIVANVCGNATAWRQIARDNKLANPSVIHAGNVFAIRCR